jgi:CheY-like chemotaxis protein
MNARKLTHDQKMGLSGMRTSLIKIQNVLNNITIMRNINRGILKQTKKKVDLKHLIATKYSNYQNRTDFNGNSFDYKYDSNIPNRLVMDQTKVDLVLSNLIDYCMTHTSNRYIHLMVALVDETTDHVKVSFKIKNIGSISIHDLVKKEGDNYIKNNLALSVIQHLIVKQNGVMKMSPVSGYGIDIELILEMKRPFSASKLPFFNKMTEELRVKKEKNAGQDTSGRKKILIAEDEPIGRITIEQMLKNDYEVILAKNGKVAVEKYFDENPDLVIMDIMMPIMNGFDAFDQIERNTIKRVPIIACTAKVINSEKEYLKSYGFDDYISKPVSIKNLRDVIKKHIT